MRDVTAKIRAIELFNPVGLPSATDPLLFPSASIYSVAVGFSARLVAFLSVSPFVPLFSARSMSCSFCHAPVLASILFPFPSYALFVIGFSVARLSPFLSRSLSLSFCLLCRLRLVGPSLFCHATLVRAVPLYLPPPVVPSSLKAVQSNRWHTKGRFCRCS